MNWFNRNSLEGLAEGVNENILALAAAVQGAVEEAYANIRGLEARLDALEQNAVAVRYADGSKLEIFPAVSAGTGSQEGKGEET
ncbi:MAG: hypothetical protein K2N87_18630 [Eubacterium sp.]|nr:hypothetical protein [Eubacterium sp.]